MFYGQNRRFGSVSERAFLSILAISRKFYVSGCTRYVELQNDIGQEFCQVSFKPAKVFEVGLGQICLSLLGTYFSNL